MIGVRGARRAALAVLSCAALAPIATAPAKAAAPEPADPCAAAPSASTPLIAAANRTGAIDLHFFGAGGAPVEFFECAAGRATVLGRRAGPAGLPTSFYTAQKWRCDRLVRHFAAVATPPGGTTVRATGTIRTRSCAQRFALTVPRRVMPGGLARIRIADRWYIGNVRTRLCITRPGGRTACRSVAFARGVVRVRTVRVDRRGRWRVELRVAGHRTRASIAVGVRAAASRPRPPTLLATGDSTMDRVASFLADELDDEATFLTDVRPGIAISKSDAWQPIAAGQVARLRPRTTVVSIGANEGWPMPAADGVRHDCCDAGWVDEFARRVRRTMTTYRHRVFWLMLAAPRDPDRVPIFAAVNTAITRAAQGLAHVRIVRLDLLLSPDGYRDVIRYRGRDVRVRDPDGIHLSIAGARIAAREVVAAIRRR